MIHFLQGASDKLVKMGRQRVDNRIEVITKAQVPAVEKHGPICPDRLQLETKNNQFPLKPSLRLVNEEHLKIIFGRAAKRVVTLKGKYLRPVINKSYR